MYLVSSVRHSWPERAGFEMERKQGYPTYTFLHFYSSVDILINGEVIRTRPHACVVYAPNVQMYYGAQESLLHDWFHFSTDRPLPNEVPCNTVFYPAEHTSITAIIRELESEFFTQRLHRNTIIDLKISELMFKLARNNLNVSMPVISRRMRENFQKLRTEMFLRPEKHWTVEEMANLVYLSTSHFHAVYTVLYGCSPHTDLINARIRTACNALTYSGKPIAVIAEELGYNNPSHFSRQFRAQTGMSPSTYRKKHLNTPESV